MRFEWDEAKNAANLKKHHLDFETAVRAFDDPNLVLVRDRADEDGEQRWHAVGFVGGMQLIVVVHVYRGTGSGEEIIRIISARKADPRESRRYFS